MLRSHYSHRCDVLRERRHSADGDAAADEGVVYTASVSACSTSFTSLISSGSTWQASDGKVITRCWATKKSRACWLGMSAVGGVCSFPRTWKRGDRPREERSSVTPSLALSPRSVAAALA